MDARRDGCSRLEHVNPTVRVASLSVGRFGSATPSEGMCLPCTSLQRIHSPKRFRRLEKLITYTISAPLLIRSSPTLA
jgi:hypothetical protein